MCFCQAREAHVNGCIDNKQTNNDTGESPLSPLIAMPPFTNAYSHPTSQPDFVDQFHCELCGKDMTKWSAQQRQQHMDRCLNKITTNLSQQLSQQGLKILPAILFSL